MQEMPTVTSLWVGVNMRTFLDSTPSGGGGVSLLIILSLGLAESGETSEVIV